MFKPSEFRNTSAENAASARLERIERAVDARLAAGHLTVDGGRSGWLTADIEVVAERYRAVGWIVIVGGGADNTFTFVVPV